ncbi:uncharacterized protein BDR25DRAFT_322453 [Lindgomyces ingoldianus]|uniref:Uncharacterized protein n=1 Tax=Lindgomyces ingoldianus TaxID=673940 RepID=A0ACB6R9T1_9PLEO|nr:uncharacterized protein BDR25DRAFT_322453 [Lindgomyces ingoldianus]KAF2475087.1 hypothetical protein BDR25DRAFT_322453 [Lindgomyces ingoldianus]
MSLQRVRIAMLNADIPVPSVRAKLVSYGDIFHNLLSTAVGRIARNFEIESTNFDIVQGEYPSLPGIDVILITGSAASAYDDVEWIHRLENYILDLFQNSPQIKIFGAASAIRVREIVVTDEFWVRLRGRRNRISAREQKLRLQFVHADHGLYQPSRVLTFQCYFEFKRFVNTETLRIFDNDAEHAGEMVLRFLLGNKDGEGRISCGAGGLLTPPLEE